MKWYIKVLTNYFQFNGRARRTEYWMFTLFSFIIALLLSFVQSFLNLGELLTWIYSLFVFIPSLAVGVRRLHDTGKSGWWILINLIPIIGAIIFIIFACMDSDYGDNEYGPNPKFRD